MAHRWRYRWALRLGGLLLALTLAGCAGSGGPEVASLSDSEEGTPAPEQSGSADLEEATLQFAECMREQGMDVPDPDFSNGQAAIQPPEGVERDDPRWQAAQEACRGLLEGVQGERGSVPVAEQEELIAFTECMREQGMDVPDPDFSNGHFAIQAPEGIDHDDPRFLAAREACDQHLKQIRKR